MTSSARPHDDIEELMAAEALGGLDESDRGRLRRAVAEHGDCRECRRLADEYRETAAHLAMALDPAPLSGGAEARLIDAARGTPEGRRTRAGRRGGPRRWIAAATVAAALVVGAGLAGYSLAPSGGHPTRVVALSGGPLLLQVAYRPGERDALVVGSNVPRPPSGKVYELWYRPEGGGPMEPAGTFVPVRGVVVAPAQVGTSFQALAVSVEPKGGSDHPTTEPIFFARA